MVLLVSEPGVLRNALEQRLGCQPSDVVPARIAGADAFSMATGKRAVVYVAAANLLEASVDPRPDPARMRRVVGTANAPGVELLVAVMPRGGAYGPEIDVLRRSGKPYIIVESDPLLEEVGALLKSDSRRAFLLPREPQKTAFTRLERVTAAVASAIDSDAHGSRFSVQHESAPLPEVLRRAARELRRPARVFGVPSSLYRRVEPLMHDPSPTRVHGGARHPLERLLRARQASPRKPAQLPEYLTLLAVPLLIPLIAVWAVFALALVLPALPVIAFAFAMAWAQPAKGPGSPSTSPHAAGQRPRVTSDEPLVQQAA